MGNSTSGFNGNSTAEQVVDACVTDSLLGKQAVITGANTGIGLETAKQLYRKGAHIVMACRTAERMEDAKEKIIKEVGDQKGVGSIECSLLDLGSLESVKDFADRWEKRTDKKEIDYLILNAGVMVPPLSRTKEGFELQIGTNHLGHFALTNRLLKNLSKGTHARIVVLSSRAHEGGKMNFDDLNFEKTSYGMGMSAYAQSKLANVLFAKELQRKLNNTAYKNVQVPVLHPGVIKTELGRDNSTSTWFYWAAQYFIKSVPQGAATTIYCTVGQDVKGGEYFQDCQQSECKPQGNNQKDAERLWDISEKLTDTKFPSDL
ncbi:retinol dehydrogenase [Acrasis kona]|uniref:Retinol dehydrogenase n=1 Tax=Acrasis kona TaxID=1008807 RepID=A0AAW2ZQZ8_9EUKA